VKVSHRSVVPNPAESDADYARFVFTDVSGLTCGGREDAAVNSTDYEAYEARIRLREWGKARAAESRVAQAKFREREGLIRTGEMAIEAFEANFTAADRARRAMYGGEPITVTAQRRGWIEWLVGHSLEEPRFSIEWTSLRPLTGKIVEPVGGLSVGGGSPCVILNPLISEIDLAGAAHEVGHRRTIAGWMDGKRDGHGRRRPDFLRVHVRSTVQTGGT